ncbi:MAG: DUF1835 domain-containing protein [Alphaproteobacteria bacterium]
MIESLAARAAALSGLPLDYPSRYRLLNLEQQKKRAKELLKAWQAGDPEALARLAARNQHPAKLADTQRTIAQELGFAKWEGLKAHTQAVSIEQAALLSGLLSALDGDARTLHIRCGSDIRDGLAIAGFRGDYLSFPYPFVHGPAPSIEPLSNFIETGARFLASVNFVQSEDAARAGLTKDFTSLKAAPGYDHICFWFEHDAYDQLCLIFLLDWFSKPAHRPSQVDVICCTGYPGVPNFHSLGELPPEALRLLWPSRRPVTVAQYSLGQAAWQALIQPTPVALYDLVTNGSPALPTLAPAVLRQLRELPALNNGLSLTEQLALTILKQERAMTGGRLFGRYTNHYEPLVFMGDLGFYNIVLRALAAGPKPAITYDKASGQQEHWRNVMHLTETGTALLENRLNWLDVAPVHRWVGGVEIRAGARAWCWDEQAAHPILRK